MFVPVCDVYSTSLIQNPKKFNLDLLQITVMQMLAKVRGLLKDSGVRSMPRFWEYQGAHPVLRCTGPNFAAIVRDQGNSDINGAIACGMILTSSRLNLR